MRNVKYDETTDVRPLDVALKTRGIAAWDIALVGDGAGSGWNAAVGWGVTLIDRQSGGRKRFHGGMSCGTVMIAELMPYIHALLWHEAHAAKLTYRPLAVRVAIISDSQELVRVGTSLADRSCPVARVSWQRPLWAALHEFTRDGYRFEYRHILRNTLALNAYADAVSSLAFDAMKHLPDPTFVGGEIATPYLCNPDTTVD